MAWVRKAIQLLASLVVASLLMAASCSSGDDDGEPSIPFAAVDDRQWPLRGNLAENARVRAEVAEVVAQWRSPGSYPPDEARSKVFWLGELDGTVLGLAAFQPAAENQATWLLEVTGQPGELAVTNARSHPLGLLGVPVLAVRSPRVGPRYLVAADVSRLEVQGQPVPVDAEGMTEVVAVPECRLTALAVGEPDPWYRLDFGLGMAEPFYPLIKGSVELGDLWADVDTCAAMAPDGWLGSGELMVTSDEAKLQPAGLIGGHPWLGTLYGSRAMVAEPEEPPGTLSMALAEYGDISYAIRYTRWLVWTYPPEVTEVELPGGMNALVDKPGLLVLRTDELPDEPLEIGYQLDGERRTVTVLPPF